jgi:predicted porin
VSTPTLDSGDAFEIGYNGDLGVKGLTAQAFYTKGDKRASKNTADADIKSTNLALSYTVGQITLSGQHVRTEGLQNGHTATAAAFATNGGLAEELTGKSIGLAYAASKELSFGLTYAKADSNAAASTETEKTIIASVGYSLGPVGIKAQYAGVTDYSGVADNDGKSAKILMFTSF